MDKRPTDQQTWGSFSWFQGSRGELGLDNREGAIKLQMRIDTRLGACLVSDK